MGYVIRRGVRGQQDNIPFPEDSEAIASVSALTNETFLGITCDYLIQLGRAVLLRGVHVEVNAHTESNSQSSVTLVAVKIQDRVHGKSNISVTCVLIVIPITNYDSKEDYKQAC